MVETLDRAMDRINAVAADAEREREEALLKEKQRIRAKYDQYGIKEPWNPNSIGGGGKVVREMMEPTIRTLQKATKEYKKALAAEGLDVS
jgi:transcription initiation factor TFIIH subunit 1